LGNFPGLRELVSNPGRVPPVGKNDASGGAKPTPLQKQPERISEFYTKIALRMQHGAQATITFTRDARVGEEAFEEVVDVDQAWSREDIEGMFKEKIDEFEILTTSSAHTARHAKKTEL